AVDATIAAVANPRTSTLRRFFLLRNCFIVFPAPFDPAPTTTGRCGSGESSPLWSRQRSRSFALGQASSSRRGSLARSDCLIVNVAPHLTRSQLHLVRPQ